MERQLWQLIHGLLADNRQVTLISVTCEYPSHPNLRWIRVPINQRPFSLKFPLFVAIGSFLTWRFRRGLLHVNGAIIFNRADVATVHLCHYAAQGQLGHRSSRNSRLYRLNAAVASRMSLFAEPFVYRAQHTRSVVAVSGGVASELAKHFPGIQNRIRTISNGVNHDTFRPNGEVRVGVRSELGLEPGRLLSIFVGSEWKGKGLRFAIEAVGRVPSVDLIVVGSGDRAYYEKLAARCGAASRVRFVGTTNHPERYMAAADVFVFPTAYESFSLVTYEAAACGLALLVTPVNGVRDILSDGVSGWFIGRDADSIARRLVQLNDDRELVARMGGCARAAATSFTWDRMVEGYVNLYDDLVKPQPNSGLS
jgi:UDP-glucose:(heptosyl)LPS alpha-1,3-glucosyltransferase